MPVVCIADLGENCPGGGVPVVCIPDRPGGAIGGVPGERIPSLTGVPDRGGIGVLVPDLGVPGFDPDPTDLGVAGFGIPGFGVPGKPLSLNGSLFLFALLPST